MFKKVIFAISGFLILAQFVWSTNAHATLFDGNAWVAHHIENNIDTGEYYFVIDPYGVDIDPNSVTMKKFEIKSIEEYLEFDDVTEKKGLLWFEINDFTDEKKYEFSFRDKSGKNYQGDAILTDFNNPDGESANPVPEPATMLLIGSGLISFAVLGRKKFFKM